MLKSSRTFSSYELNDLLWRELVKVSLDDSDQCSHRRATAVSRRIAFEMHYTPKKGSWLNMAELELSALSRICLSRRIPSMEELDREIQSLVKERNQLAIKVEWQFSIAKARKKLSRHYEKVLSKD